MINECAGVNATRQDGGTEQKGGGYGGGARGIHAAPTWHHRAPGVQSDISESRMRTRSASVRLPRISSV